MPNLRRRWPTKGLCLLVRHRVRLSAWDRRGTGAVNRVIHAADDFKLANPRTSCQVTRGETWSPIVAHRVSAAGVPCVPGYHGNNQDPDLLLQEAEKIGSFRRTRTLNARR